MSKKDKNDQNINSIPKYLWGNYFKKPIKWLAHLINDYGNSKHPFITTGTSYAYAIGDEKRRHPELTELQARENVDLRIKQNRKKLGLPTENTPSLAAAGLALGSLYYPWLAVPDIIFDTAASIDEPSTSNNLHTIADFPETVAKFTPSKIDDYVAKGVLTLGNIDDAVSTSGKNMFSIFDKKTGKINNTIDKTSVRESTNIKYRKNGGYIRKMLTASGGPIELYDTLWVDNWRNRLTSPTVVAKQLEELTSKIPIKYLGGNKDNARKEFWKQEPVFQHAVDSIANQYGISPESLKYRLDREGFTDYNIKRRNTKIKKGHQQFEPRGYKLLNDHNYNLAGTQIGLDDAKTYIDSGRVKLINEKWFDLGTFKNEKGRITYPVEPATLNDGMGIVAAHLKYFRDKALLDFPNASEYDLDRYANAYYNRGALGGKKWVLAGAKGYNYRKQGGKMNILEFLKNGSGIHIKEKNKGKFTSYCGGKVTDECILRGKNSSNPAIRKRATFALNSRRWAKHKKGGKAFVSGVSILDSNPDAYKEVKKRLKKHLEGGKVSTWLKIGNFLNSDIKGVIGLGSLIFNGLKTGADVAKFSNSFDSATDATVKAMESKMKADSYLKGLLKAQQVIAQKQQENPDIRFGEIDLRNMALNFSNEFYDSDTIDNYKALRAQEKLWSMKAIQGSAGNSINWLDSLGGIASNFLNKSSNNNSNLSSTITPKLTTNTWKPSTSLSTPSLGTGTQGSIPDFSYMLNPNYKV